MMMIIPGLFLVLPQAPPPFVPVPMRGFWSRRARPAVEGGTNQLAPTGQPTLPSRPMALPCKRHLNLETTHCPNNYVFLERGRDKWQETLVDKRVLR